MVTIDAHIHQPLFHCGVVNHVGRPLVALDVVALVLPVVGIEVAEIDFVALMVLHFFYSVRIVGTRVVDAIAVEVGKKRAVAGFAIAESGPVLVIAGRGGVACAEVRTIDVIAWRGLLEVDGVHEDRWIVAYDALTVALGMIGPHKVSIGEYGVG